ncbi:MAG TPA: MarR family transcriptional regulator, partial [Sphingomonas sp.]|nr:MarR family transcriptional regulator [Sphingomonas sp.]
INQGAAGRILGIQRANMVSLINELIDRGLVDRTADPEDRRALALVLTPAGQEMLAAATAHVREHEDALLAPLAAKERTTLIALLARLTPP